MSIENILQKNAEAAAAALEVAKETHLELEKFFSTEAGKKFTPANQNNMLASARAAYNAARTADIEASEALYIFQNPGN